jgi:hypothetical protein
MPGDGKAHQQENIKESKGRVPGTLSENDEAEAANARCASSTRQGGGKRRGSIMGNHYSISTPRIG